MRVITKARLKYFWEAHAGTEASLAAWHQVVKNSDWANFAEMRSTFWGADQVGRLTVFNVKGNDLRVIARVDFARGIVYVRAVCTHAEYDKNDWKKDDWF